jgi:hypothetical protein
LALLFDSALDLEPLLGGSSYPLYDFQDIEGVALSSLSNPSPAFFSYYKKKSK